MVARARGAVLASAGVEAFPSEACTVYRVEDADVLFHVACVFSVPNVTGIAWGSRSRGSQKSLLELEQLRRGIQLRSPVYR